ncbi:MAG TPA: DUF3373 family protein [Noviherbaspirillum sp.]|uniref:DUF3373 domain-containing protein n=1 Tax=Noviherbaspirillum sp. TaxID=1926288 RepID=UPI002B465C9B|nr:DUF3373 family protein [Noviherbaspirillum sp.]HJV85247.1 DUF3373 family protein [Noviherbaspirillum sp.]
MKHAMSKRVLAALISGLAFPSFAAGVADADLLKKIEALSSELEQLKKQVQQNEEKAAARTADAVQIEELKSQIKKVEDKSIGKWLTVGGDYRFRVDSLRGQTKAFTDVNATFANAQQKLQADFFNNPSTAAGSSSYFGAPAAGGMSTAGALGALMGFSQAINAVKTHDQAVAFVSNPQNAGLIQGIGAFAVPVPSYKPDNATLYTNRFGLDLNAKATQDVSVNARMVMYKVFGAQDEGALTNGAAAPYFADRVGVFDGTLGHIPSTSYLNVDRAYGTWSNIGDQDIWFSVGRRPSTNGYPSNLKQNTAGPGKGGTPSLLVDYAFDGMTLGWAPDIESLPGAYAKLCYGRGYESGFRSTPANAISDTDMLGISVVPIDTDKLRAWLQWNRGFNIFDAPTMRDTYFGNTVPKTNLGDIDWFGGGAMGKLKKVGSGDLNWFADVATSITHPNQNVSAQFGFQGLLTGAFFAPEAASSKTGWAFATGLRYDLPSRTKIGLEYNHGSKNWITFAPAADDMWTTKVGTRGNVYETYLIQELDRRPISSFFSKAFFRVGFQYYDFEYTGSNNWVGAPVKISDVRGQMMTMTPLEKAYNLYATFEVKF